jgi:hypothetical protein
VRPVPLDEAAHLIGDGADLIHGLRPRHAVARLSQTVRVEHVTVAAGAKAIIGPVTNHTGVCRGFERRAS